MTNKKWPWKLESSKECVTTHCSNRVTPKMNGDNLITDPLPLENQN